MRTTASRVRLLGAASAATLTAALVASCESVPSLPDLALTVSRADRSSPLAGTTVDRVRATFRTVREGGVDDVVEVPVVDGSFDLVVPIETFAAPMELELELLGPSGVERFGATPTFYPAERLDLRVLVGAEGSCDLVTGVTLTPARTRASAALVGTYALLSGGVAASGPIATVDALDLLGFERLGITPGDAAPGPTRAVPLDRTRVLVAPEGALPFVYRLYAQDLDEVRVRPALHAGAASADALVEWPGVGALVVGGGDDAAPSAAASVIVPGGTATAPVETVRGFTLAAARSERAAAAVASVAYVLSSDGATASLESLAPDAAASTVRLASIADGVRRAPHLFVSADGGQLLLVGGLDGLGAVRTDTVWIRGCPLACEALAGPTWTTAREGASATPDGLLVGGDGSARLERVVFAASVPPSLASVATLSSPRADAAVVRLPTGPTLVLAGEGTAGPRGDLELCFLR